MPIQQILPNGLVRIQNSNTGEVKDVTPQDLGKYNPALVDSYQKMIQPAPQNNVTPNQPQAQTQAQPSPSPDLATTIGGLLGNILQGALKPVRFVGQAGAETGASGINLLQSILGQRQTAFNPQVMTPEELKQIQSPDGSRDVGKVALEGAKNIANVASYAIPFGKGANLLTKVLGPGAIVGGLQGASQDNATPESIAGNAVLGAGGAGVLSGITPLLSKALGGVSVGADAGASVITKSQFRDVAKNVLDKNQVGDTLSRLSKYGFRNIDQISQVAPLVTGDTGVITQLTRDAVANAKPVNTSGLLDYTKELLDKEPLITETVGNKFRNLMSKAISATSGGNIGGGDPLAMYDFARQLEGKASSLRYGNDEAKSLGGVYQEVANTIKDKIFKDSGADNALIGTVLTPERLQQLQQISPKLADEVSNVKTIGELRSLAAPFVRGSKLTQAAENAKSNELPGDLAASGGFAALQAILGGLSPATAVAGGAGFLAKKTLMSNTGKALGSNILSKAGIGAKTGSEALTNLNANPLFSYLAGQTGARIPISNPGTLPNVVGNNADRTNYNGQDQSKQNILPPSGNNITPPVNNNQITPEMVKQAYLKYPAVLADRVKAAYEAQTGGANPQQRGLVKAGTNNIDVAEKMFNQDPNLLTKQLLPGHFASRQFDAALYDAVDALLRLRTGAQANPTEIRGYMQRIGPTFGDSPETVKFKFNQLRNDLSSYVGGQ